MGSDAERRLTAELPQMQVPMIPLDLLFHSTRPDVVFNAKFEASDVSLRSSISGGCAQASTRYSGCGSIDRSAGVRPCCRSASWRALTS